MVIVANFCSKRCIYSIHYKCSNIQSNVNSFYYFYSKYFKLETDTRMKMTLEIDAEVNKFISLLQIEAVENGEPKPTKADLINQLARKGMEAMQKEKGKEKK